MHIELPSDERVCALSEWSKVRDCRTAALGCVSQQQLLCCCGSRWPSCSHASGAANTQRGGNCATRVPQVQCPRKSHQIFMRS